MDEIETLQYQIAKLENALANEPLTLEQAYAAISEIAEYDAALQRLFAPLDTISDALLCRRFGTQL